MRLAAVLAVTAVVAASLAAQAQTAIHGRLCGQVKHGPADAWTWRAAGKTTHFHGTTWSVFAQPAVPCAQAKKAAPALLAAWTKAKPGTSILSVKGWACDKVQLPAQYGSGSDGVSCVDYGGNSAKTFSIVMLAPYPPAAALRILAG